MTKGDICGAAICSDVASVVTRTSTAAAISKPPTGSGVREWQDPHDGRLLHRHVSAMVWLLLMQPPTPEEPSVQVVTTVGLDIAKSVFQVHGVDAVGQVVIRRQLKRRYGLAFFEKFPRAWWASRPVPRRTIGRGSFAPTRCG